MSLRVTGGSCMNFHSKKVKRAVSIIVLVLIVTMVLTMVLPYVI